MQKTENMHNAASDRPLVSVIVPVYRVEEYIERCVQSIMDQDYPRLEIILVDDGSPDNCGRLIDEMADWDSRIRVIHKENRGVSSARNQGLSVAAGDYIAFVDGDDYLSEDCISYFVELAESSGCDMAISRNNFTSFEKNQVAADNRSIVSPEYVMEALYLGRINVAVWNKLYRHDFIRAHALRFQEDIWYGEGMLFNIECLQFLDRVALGERKVYHQVLNQNSAMRKFSLESNYCGLRSLEIQKQKWIRKNEGIEKAFIHHKRQFADSILSGLVRENLVDQHKEEYRRCIKTLRSDVLVPLCVDIPLKRKLYFLVAAVCPVFLAKRNALKKKLEKNRMQYRSKDAV